MIDFGTSHHYDTNNEMSELFGTPYYIAPEILVGNYNEKCDLWSVGVILFIMISGSPPIKGVDDDEILAKVKKGTWSFPQNEIWDEVSVEAKDLISKLMEKDPNQRISATEALKHPWILKQVHKPFDKTLANNAIDNMKQFRVSTLLL